MKKRIIYKYAVEYLNGKIHFETARELINKHFFLAASYQLARYKLLKQINWVNNNELDDDDF